MAEERQYNNRRHNDSDSGDYNKGAPMGYFKAQPFDLGLKKKKKMDPFLDGSGLAIDYKDAKLLSRFVSERGRILPRRMTGLTAHNQRKITMVIKRA